MKRIFVYGAGGSVNKGTGEDRADIETHVNLALTACGHRAFVKTAIFRHLGGEIFATPVMMSGESIGFRIFVPRVGDEELWNEVIARLIDRGYVEVIDTLSTH